YPNATMTPTDLDLKLPTLWFTQTPPSLPPSLPFPCSTAYTANWTRVGPRITHMLVLTLRWTPNLSSTTVRITWDAASPALSARAEQRHAPPPPPPSRRQLQAVQARFGDAVARWCEARIGVKVGDGECWTLAHDALEATGAMPSI